MGLVWDQGAWQTGCVCASNRDGAQVPLLSQKFALCYARVRAGGGEGREGRRRGTGAGGRDGPCMPACIGCDMCLSVFELLTKEITGKQRRVLPCVVHPFVSFSDSGFPLCLMSTRTPPHRLYLACELVAEIRACVWRELQYTCSAGIAHNRKFSKLIACKNKPNGLILFCFCFCFLFLCVLNIDAREERE